MERKIDRLVRLMNDGSWNDAIRMAARFPRLGEHREAITTAASALLSPAFYVSLGRCPDNLVAAGISALRERYASYL